ncbi:Transcriptional regulator, AraC family [Cupriavidus sp. U2]|uniref:AraC family transcriptional regulator n=1 Tax=Cupriavidus sp. U2 TaxID=2920269 RepID=UPI00129DCB27|nr:AraC family transcriptional regulator [Cupriavidus sp. U2]KAI3593204.1 Transcriptional regulator, AraC family [Cupriavidus sp. U2]
MSNVGRLVRSATLNGYIELVESLGQDPVALLRAAGLSARLLKNPETLIPSSALRELLEATVNATGREDFALQMAARRTFSNLGPISLVLKEAPSPRQGLETLCRYLKLLSTSLVTHVEDVGQTVIIREDLLPSPGYSTRQAMELAVGMMFRILRELIGPQWRPLQVCFTHRPPASLTAHQTFFGRKPMFNQPFNGLVCASADLQKPRTPDHSGATQLARDYLEAALRNRGEGTRESCRELIMALLPGGRCTAQQVARHLRVDRRTLHRYLSADGQTTFSGLLDEVRSELVIRHLAESDQPIGEIASLLGFSNQSSFSHWFRAEFGCSVTQWRRQQPPGQGSPIATTGRRRPRPALSRP